MKKLLIAVLFIPLAMQAQDDKQKRVETNSKEINEMIAKLDELSNVNKGILAKSITKTEYDSVMQILSNTKVNAPDGKTAASELNWLHDEMEMLEELIKDKKQAKAEGTSTASGVQVIENKALVKQLDTMKMAAKAQKVMLDTITQQLAVIKDLVKNTDVKVINNSNMTRIDEKGESVNLEHGYYVVLESFKGKEGTPKVIKAWKKKGLDVIVVYNRERDWYFVYSEKYNELKTALGAMEKTRSSGLVKDAWVHNYHPKEEGEK